MANGKIKADTLEHSTAGSVTTDYVVNGSAKVWVNFNGTGTIAARDSLNVSGLVDNSTGNYTVNISDAFTAATFSVAMGGNSFHTASLAATSGTFTCFKYNSSHSAEDASDCYFNAHGDLA